MKKACGHALSKGHGIFERNIEMSQQSIHTVVFSTAVGNDINEVRVPAHWGEMMGVKGQEVARHS